MPGAPGLFERTVASGLHLAWTTILNYAAIALAAWALWPGPDGAAGASVNVPAILAITFLSSVGAGALAARCAARHLGIPPRDAASLAPALLLILVLAGLPSLLLCAVLVFAYFIGFVLAAILAPFFLSIIAALLSLPAWRLLARDPAPP